jgi:ABC-type proline/glycine betaine transport system ATPase subunit
MQLTQSERIALIKNAHLSAQGFSSKKVEELANDFVEDVKTEEVVSRHGLLGNHQSDIQDEKQFLNSDVAEDIEDEDKDIGISDQMKESLGLSTERVYEEEGGI